MLVLRSSRLACMTNGCVHTQEHLRAGARHSIKLLPTKNQRYLLYPYVILGNISDIPTSEDDTIYT